MKPSSATYFLANAAIIRAVESNRPKRGRLLDDPVARRLLPPLWRWVPAVEDAVEALGSTRTISPIIWLAAVSVSSSRSGPPNIKLAI